MKAMVEQNNQIILLLRNLADQIEANECEVQSCDLHAPIRDITPPGELYRRVEHTGHLILFLSVYRAKGQNIFTVATK